jgi:hypothetical protein
MTEIIVPSAQVEAALNANTRRINGYETVKPEELARRLNVPTTWVYDQVRSRAKDPMPHLRLGKYVRFQPDSPEFQAWMERHRSGR